MLRASSPTPVSDLLDEVASLRKQLRHQQQAHREMQTMLKSEDFVRAELTAAQRFEDSLQRQYDGQLRSHVHALQDECLDRVGQEEDKLRKELQQALTQESSICRDQLHQTLRHQVCQEEHADAISTRKINQLRQMVSEQEDALMRLNAHSQHLVSQQQEEYAQAALCSSSLTVLSKTRIQQSKS